MTLKPNRNRFFGSCLIGTTALALEVLGVSSGAYYYGGFPLKLLGVPPSIILMWIAVAQVAYHLFEAYGSTGAVVVPLFDLFLLEPLAYYVEAWRWVTPYTLLVEPFGTTANFVVWLGMCCLGVMVYSRSSC